MNLKKNLKGSVALYDKNCVNLPLLSVLLQSNIYSRKDNTTFSVLRGLSYPKITYNYLCSISPFSIIKKLKYNRIYSGMR